MKKVMVWLSMLYCMAATGAYAQSLKVGDTLKGVTEFLPGDKIKILEFWNTHCLSCVRGFPKLQALRDKFKGELEIVLVTNEAAKIVDDLFTRQKKIFRPTLPFINEDTVLKKQFDDLPLPFQAWIARDGKVLAITEVSELDEADIRAMIAGNTVIVKPARKRKVNSSLIQAGPKLWDAKVNYYSYLADCSSNIMVGHARGGSTGEGKIRLSQDCARLLDLYKVAYSEKEKFTFYNPFNIKLDVTDKHLFENGRYSYDLVVPAHRSAEIFQMMQQDLQRNFGFKAIVSRNYCKVLEMTGQPGPNLLATKGGDAVVDFSVSGKALNLKLRNQPFDTLVNVLQKFLPEYPMVLEDRSSYGTLGNIDIDLVVDLRNEGFIESIITELGKYNLKIFIHDIPMDVLTVTDK